MRRVDVWKLITARNTGSPGAGVDGPKTSPNNWDLCPRPHPQRHPLVQHHQMCPRGTVWQCESQSMCWIGSKTPGRGTSPHIMVFIKCSQRCMTCLRPRDASLSQDPVTSCLITHWDNPYSAFDIQKNLYFPPLVISRNLGWAQLRRLEGNLIEMISDLGEKKEIKSVRSVLIFCQQMSSPFNFFVTWFLLQWGAFLKSLNVSLWKRRQVQWCTSLKAISSFVTCGAKFGRCEGAFHQEWSFTF